MSRTPFENQWLTLMRLNCKNAVRLRYHLKKRSAFYAVCTDYRRPNDSFPFIYHVDEEVNCVSREEVKNALS